MRCWLQSWFPLSHDVCDSTLHSDFTLCSCCFHTQQFAYLYSFMASAVLFCSSERFLPVTLHSCVRARPVRRCCGHTHTHTRARVDVCRGDFSCRNHFSTRWKQFRWAVAAVASCCFLWGNMFLWLQTLRGHLALYQSKLIHSLILWISFEMIFT